MRLSDKLIDIIYTSKVFPTPFGRERARDLLLLLLENEIVPKYLLWSFSTYGFVCVSGVADTCRFEAVWRIDDMYKYYIDELIIYD